MIFSTEEMKPGFLLRALLYVYNVQTLLVIYWYAIIEIIFILIAFRKFMQIWIMTQYCSYAKINILLGQNKYCA